MSDTYNADALWLKAKLFLNHAMDDDGVRTFDEQALWAALALELLAKAALSRHSPVLIAAPNEDGGNLLAAVGLTKADRFASVPAKTLISRCSKAFPPFSERESSLIMQARNEYLHGGAAVYTKLPASAWWPKYWSQAAILVLVQDRTIEDLVGTDRIEIVEAYLATNKQNIEHRAQTLIGRAQQRYAQIRSGKVSVKDAAEWTRFPDRTAGLEYRDTAGCPSCGEEGIVEGDYILGRDRNYERISEDDYDVWDELTVSAEYFSCQECQLVLDSAELVAAAGLEETFWIRDDDPDTHLELEYGND